MTAFVNIIGWILVIFFVGTFCFAALSIIVHRLNSLATGRVRVTSRQGLLAIFYVGVCLAIINWLVGGGIIYDMVIGGDAFRGRIGGDEYYLGRGGEYTEVSKGFWWFSFWYQMASHLLLAFFIAGIGILVIWGRIKGDTFDMAWIDQPTNEENDRASPSEERGKDPESPRVLNEACRYGETPTGK